MSRLSLARRYMAFKVSVKIVKLPRSPFLIASLAVLYSTAAGYSGGYVSSIVELTASPGPGGVADSQSYWLALIPLAILYFASQRSSDGNRAVSPPRGPAGPCFCEGTLVQMNNRWTPVEEVRAGDTIMTSKGEQTVLHVASWQPTEFRDRACLVKGVRMTANHGVFVDGFYVMAGDLSPRRVMNDGSHYYHILVKDHSWLFAKADITGETVRAESLFITATHSLSSLFPALAKMHSLEPAAPKQFAEV